MEEMSPAVAVPFRLGNSVCDNPTVASHMDVTRFKLMTDATSLLSDSATQVSTESIAGEDDNCSDLENEVSVVAVSVPVENREEGAALLDMVSENKSNWVAGDDVVIRESEEDDFLSVEGDPILDSSCSLSVTSETSSICGEDLLAFEANFETGTPGSLDIEKDGCNDPIIAKSSQLGELNAEQEIVSDSLAVTSLEEEIGFRPELKSSEVVIQLPVEKGVSGTLVRSVFELVYVPLWGFTSICGRRPEMEDAVATVPRFFQIPIQMLIGDRVIDGMSKCVSHLTAHFFGVYDGHGGSQVANYCRDRIHSALAEEIETAKTGFSDGNVQDYCKELWTKVFTNCFLKVDAEVGGKASLEPVAPETVGSTAVVAIICSSHIIVANCGDSRAVLYRGKEPIALSVDHKPNREDEYARIEAAGGKVIQWNGHRVFGVLAMSRSIGIVCLGYKGWVHMGVGMVGSNNKLMQLICLRHLTLKVLWEEDYIPSDGLIHCRIPSVLHAYRTGTESHFTIHITLGRILHPGDRYLKPWIIPEPEVTFIPRAREDECLVLASDGLWDVMTNEEVCDIARRRILLWHKKNGVTMLPSERGQGIDPAAQAAAECLSNRALQKGSKDNITVIVVDLKAQRKFKSKT
ncbi:Protein phosphatase 2C 7 [Vitis vinifera]|uniref:protein-serine/threonine phosphatase n=1 Tax=Vitis vinifera TaxID=29760 RepID=A0A438EXJ4_VITVI|nr:Protein phosphatase 2C 7 [Vitis vinifera]